MRRRQLMVLLGGATLWPLAARGQQPALPVIGFLSSASNAPSVELTPKAFRAGLNEAGYFVGRNVAIEVFPANGRYDRLPALADEMVRRRVNLIVAGGGLASARAAKAATSKIPILFIAGFDPVKLGLVSRINRPGGNATGLSIYTTELLAKRLEFLRELVPHASLVALLVNPLSPAADIETDDMESVARANGFRLLALSEPPGAAERRCRCEGHRLALSHSTWMRPAKVSATTGPADTRSTTGCSPVGSAGKSPPFLSIPNNDLRNRRIQRTQGFRLIGARWPASETHHTTRLPAPRADTNRSQALQAA